MSVDKFDGITCRWPAFGFSSVMPFVGQYKIFRVSFDLWGSFWTQQKIKFWCVYLQQYWTMFSGIISSITSVEQLRSLSIYPKFKTFILTFSSHTLEAAVHSTYQQILVRQYMCEEAMAAEYRHPSPITRQHTTSTRCRHVLCSSV